jgi:hypothetical protein
VFSVSTALDAERINTSSSRHTFILKHSMLLQQRACGLMAYCVAIRQHTQIPT